MTATAATATAAAAAVAGLDERAARPESPAGVLAFARERRRAADRAEAEVLEAACWWADLHPAESLAVAATCEDSGRETAVPVSGAGVPLVCEFSIAEFAAVLGVPTGVGTSVIGEAMELRHRLPRLWARVLGGDLPAWRARRVARATMVLTAAAAGFVDRHAAPVAHRLGPVQTDRLVEEAVARFLPDQARAQHRAAADRRHLTVHDHPVSFDGTVWVTGELDLADGLDLDAALTAGAATLAALGSTDPLDVRRSIAAGDPAAATAGGDDPEGLAGHGAQDGRDRTDTGRVRRVAPRAARRVVLHLHLAHTAVTGRAAADGGDGTPGDGAVVGRVADTGDLVTADQIRDWCHTAGRVTVQPVLDLAGHVHVGAYQVPDRIADQVELRDHCCVFPWCPTQATRCDKDHVVPHALGGPTCACNLAPLCRRHHRLKTHGRAWRLTIVEPGTYLWTTPAGYQFLRDHTGTRDVTPGRPRPPDT